MAEKINNFPSHEITKKPAAYHNELAGLTSLIAEKQNRKMFGLLPNCESNHFDADSRINIYAFNQKLGGSYSEETIAADAKEGRMIEDSLLPDVNLESVRAYVEDKTGKSDIAIEDMKDVLKEEAELRDGIIAEIAINALLNKVLSKKNLIVARASKYDDLKNGVDTFIFNPETGEIVCGFDEVNYLDEDKDDARPADRKVKKEGILKKKAKVLKVAREGGARIKYAYRLAKDEAGGKSVKQGLVENLPILYLGISKSDLETLLKGMDYKNGESANETEQMIFKKIVSSIEDQLAMLKKEADNIPKPVRKNLNKLPDFLKRLEE